MIVNISSTSSQARQQYVKLQGLSKYCTSIIINPGHAGCILRNMISYLHFYYFTISGIVLFMHPANERQHYSVTLSLIGWAHTQNDHRDIELAQVVVILPQGRQGPFFLWSEYYGCWWPGGERSQSISIHVCELISSNILISASTGLEPLDYCKQNTSIP